MYAPSHKEWGKRYMEKDYSMAICKFCGCLVNRNWGVNLHDKIHLQDEDGHWNML